MFCLTLQFASFVVFEIYGRSIGGFGQNYRIFYLWGRITTGLFLGAITSALLGRTKGWSVVLLGSTALEAAWWMLAMAA